MRYSCNTWENANIMHYSWNISVIYAPSHRQGCLRVFRKNSKKTCREYHYILHKVWIIKLQRLSSPSSRKTWSVLMSFPLHKTPKLLLHINVTAKLSVIIKKKSDLTRVCPPDRATISLSDRPIRKKISRKCCGPLKWATKPIQPK